MADEYESAGDGLATFSRLYLDLRGVCFVIDRETLMSLPESILLCLFPNGLLLPDPNEDISEEKQVYFVDSDPQCLQFVLSFFRRAQEYFYGTDVAAGVYRGAGLSPSYLDLVDPVNGDMMNGFGHPLHLPLFHKQAVILLREELEFFTIPPRSMAKSATMPDVPPNMPPNATPAFTQLKDACGNALLMRRQIFTALQRNVNKENNMAEQHLIDMLCMSGFEPNDQWGYRAREPARCAITSTALVLLKTGVTQPGELLDGRAPNAPPLQRPIGVHRAGVNMDTGIPVNLTPSPDELGEWVDDGQGGSLCVNQQQLSTTQKLLLFWRKPAVCIYECVGSLKCQMLEHTCTDAIFLSSQRKCWWDGIDIVVPQRTMHSEPPTPLPPHVLGTLSPQERSWLDQGIGQCVRVWVRRVWTLEVSLVSNMTGSASPRNLCSQSQAESSRSPCGVRLLAAHAV